MEMKTLDEVKSIIGLHEKNLRQKYKAHIVGIFGSWARGEHTENSDLDLLAVFDKSASLLDLTGAEVYLSEHLGTKVDLIPQEDIRPELKNIIAQEAIAV